MLGNSQNCLIGCFKAREKIVWPFEHIYQICVATDEGKQQETLTEY